jgi:hypothetical protein
VEPCENCGRYHLGLPVKGYPDYYVAFSGDIWSTKRGKPYKLSHQLDQDGYPHVNLYVNGKHHTIKVQRLVALHFLGPRPEGMVVCHNDGNKLNCSGDNLRYDTQGANIADIYIHGNENPPQGSRNGMSKLTEELVRELRRLREEEGLSNGELAARFSISARQARDIIARHAWRHV